MKDHKSLHTKYRAYPAITDLSPGDRELLKEANAACSKSYAPYSKFHVGAALHTSSGTIVTGANQENASFPIGACAERVAIYQLKLLYPGEVVTAIAITARMSDRDIDEPVSPCGSCRQILVELEQAQKAPVKLILRGTSGPVIVFDKARDLLPFSFDPNVFLGKDRS